ncbi:MAG TPA: hypothetical protein VMU95_01315 [Trebonia sp.]|nr:hypothetical protein [Trebonia sp.]
MDTITKVALAVVTVALVATLVVNGENTSKVISAGGSAFSNSLSAAERG